MKKFLLTLAVVAFSTSAMIAQNGNATNNVQEDPARLQMMHLSRNPTGNDIATGYDQPQAVSQKHEQCKGHKDGEACNKPADQQCPDCKAKAAAKKECKQEAGKQCEKAAGKQCEKAAGKQCEKAAGKQCEKAAGKQCEKAAQMTHEQCKGHKDGEACNKPADQQCPDCKAKAAAKKQ